MNDEEEKLIFTVDYDALLQTGVSINQFLFLQLIYNNKSQRYYEFYLEQFPEGKTVGIQYLVDKGLLTTKDRTTNFTYNNFKTTDLFKKLFYREVEDAVKELEETYPKVTPAKKRRLQSDKAKWSANYLKIVKSKPDLHRFILKCIEVEKKHRKSTNVEEFWPLLTTYVNNRRWEDYAEDALKMGDKSVLQEVDKTYDI